MSICRDKRDGRDRCSTHARRRMQQRCISFRRMDAAITYGDEHRTHSGYIYFLSSRTCRRLQRTLPPAEAREIARFENCYVVEDDDGTIVTVGHRTKRIRR